MANPAPDSAARYFPPQTPSSALPLGSRFPAGPGSYAISPRPSSFSRDPNLRASLARQPRPGRTQRGSAWGPFPDDSASSFPPEKFYLASDPTVYRTDVFDVEPDDAIHDPAREGRHWHIFTARGFGNVGCLTVVCAAILALFIGYPILTRLESQTQINLLVNATGQIASIANYGLIDEHTPEEMYNIASYYDPSQSMQLVFSDEFETQGRSFYPGDDPYWEAVDLHYWQTGNLEWYDPSTVTTVDGALQINLSKVADPSTNHNLSYMGGMVTSWNKFCFTGGVILANVMMPGLNNVFGLWPAVWTMGNLGRAGYGASLDGLWPYSYDACDVGTLANQTLNGGPTAALDSGAAGKPYFGELSYMPGQRLSRCTCSGESHPGPKHKDGTYVGRSAPEIDLFEGQMANGADGTVFGTISQSAQWAPFDAAYTWANTSDNMVIVDATQSHQNTYAGGVYQEPTSVVSETNQSCYQFSTGCFSITGFEYVPGYDNAYIRWVTNDETTWTLNAAGIGANLETQISARPISEEPMYIIMNLGISPSFGFIDFEHLVFPSIMRIDWIRVYQHPGKINIGCDPPDFPTAAYINTYSEAYTNPLLTTWVNDYGQSLPRNNLIDQC
ncbi:beta-glucan synthesis-associated [Mycena galericulata]|nr:beta-glucan synthesis-associated [Mycena galericulata]